MAVARANGVHTFGFGGLLQVPLLGELMVAGGQVVGRPRKAAKTETNTGSLLRLMSIELAMLTSHPVLLFSLSFSLSQHQGLFHESALCTRWPKYCSFSLSIRPLNQYSGLIPFRIDWVDLLAVQRTPKSLL